MDEFEKLMQAEAQRRGVTLDQETLADMRHEYGNFVNEQKLANAKLQPGQAERMQRLGLSRSGGDATPSDDPEDEGIIHRGLAGGLAAAKTIPQGIYETGKSGAELVADLLAVGNSANLGKAGVDAAWGEVGKDVSNLGQGLVNTVKRPYDIIQQSQRTGEVPSSAEIGGAFGGAAALGLGGMEALRRGGAGARAAGLIDKLKGASDQPLTNAARNMTDAELAAQPLGTTPPLEQSAAAPGAQDRFMGKEQRLGGERRVYNEPVPLDRRAAARRGPPQTVGLAAPSDAFPTRPEVTHNVFGVQTGLPFEEDVMPEEFKPSPNAGGLGVENIAELYRDILNPAKEAAPEKGAGFRAVQQAQRNTRSARAKAGRYRQSEDNTGGQPE